MSARSFRNQAKAAVDDECAEVSSLVRGGEPPE